MQFLVLIGLCLGYFAAVGAQSLPPYIKPCPRSDPNLNDCALKQAKSAGTALIKGDPKYKIPPLDPFLIEKLVVADTANKAIGLNFTCEKCIVTGLKDSTIDYFRMDLKNNRIEMGMTIPKLEVKGKYSVNGKVLLFPIKGNGDSTTTMSTKMNAIINYDLVKKKDNKEYIQVKNIKMDNKVSQASIYLTNLFNGDKTLGDNMNKLLNENWQEIVKTFGPAVDEVITEIMEKITNEMAGRVPIDNVLTK